MLTGSDVAFASQRATPDRVLIDGESIAVSGARQLWRDSELSRFQVGARR